VQALGSALIGDSEPLRRYDVLLNEAAVTAKALELGLGGVTGELSEAAKVQARYALILEQTVPAQGDLADTADSLGNRLKATRVDLLEFRKELGEAVVPALEEVLEVLPGVIDLVGAAAPVVGELASQFSNVVGPVGEFAGILNEIIGEAGPLADLLGEAGAEGSFLADAGQAIKDSFVPTLLPIIGLLQEFNREYRQAFPEQVETPLDLLAEKAIRDSIAAQLSAAEELRTETILSSDAVSDLVDGYRQLEQIGSGGIGDAGTAAERSAAQFLAFKDVLDQINQNRLDLGPLEADLAAVSQAIEDTFEPNKNGDIFASIDEFVADLGRRFRESTEFEAGLAELTLRGFGALAEVIRTEGPKAADLLASSLADPAAAAEAEALLTDQANTLGSGYATGFALGIESGDAEVARALAETVESEAVRAGILAAASDLALLFAANFDPQILIDNFDISLPADVIRANVGPGADLVGGSSSTDFGAQGSARGFNVTIINPTVTDLDTSVGQATSTLGAISGLVQ
jgi:hypothetical protein